MINQQKKKAIYRIKAVLAEKQLSDKWLANEIGRTENTVSRWCSNKVQPFLENLLKIAKALKVDVRDLLKSTEE
ncbi:helix-turn-helix domain-containing protein [Prevotella sp.]|uniref:helix-turn-helix domain-containing protein n=1 Tax=Prevotella sp. TaxID=59823 RepID=UPI001CB5C745|nr:helix-turn-helix transcriptional regulator [Prevotella sp.]MBF1640453.1 helix-turn-helix transcriptional regulator [Prevotella sp.]